MASDLAVDLELLESTAGSLGMLTEEFQNANAIVDGYEPAIGQHDLCQAMNKFAHNWKTHREDLLKSMVAVHKMVTKSHDAFIDTDSQLAADIAKAVTPIARPPR